jgi:hypothetical protein
MTHLTLQTPDDADALRSLEDWLRRDPQLRGTRVAPIHARTGPTEMGGAADALELLLGHGELVGAVAGVVGAWFGTRVRRTKIYIKHDGREVSIEADRKTKPDQVARTIMKELGRLNKTTPGI